MMDCGVDLITIHGRTLHENKIKVRECNWNAIRDARNIVQEYYDAQEEQEDDDDNDHADSGDEGNMKKKKKKRIIPIIANGGIEDYDNVLQCFETTKANAVISSEALLENPGLFNPHHHHNQQEQSLTPKEIFHQQIRYCHQYLDLCILFPPLPGSLGKKGGSFNVIRSHLFKILYRYLEEQPDLRTALAEPKKMTTVQKARELVYELERQYSNVDNEKESENGEMKGDNEKIG